MAVKIRGSRPKFRQIKEELSDRIKLGVIPVGALLPSEGELSKLFGASRTTIRAALQELRETGLVSGCQGRRNRAHNPKRRRRFIWVCPCSQADTEPVYLQIYNNFVKEAEKRHASVTYWTVHGKEDEKWFAAHLGEFDGVVMSGFLKPKISPEFLGLLEGLPNAVTMDRYPDAPESNIVFTDNRLGGMMAARHLLERGHRRLFVLATARFLSLYPPMWERAAGFVEAVVGSGLPDATVHVCSGDVPENKEDIAPFLKQAGVDLTDCDAVFAVNDRAALSVLEILADRGVEVPGQVSVLGFDGVARGAMSHPALTSIGHPFAGIAEKAYELLSSNVGQQVRGRLILVAPSILERGSVASRKISPT